MGWVGVYIGNEVRLQCKSITKLIEIVARKWRSSGPRTDVGEERKLLEIKRPSQRAQNQGIWMSFAKVSIFRNYEYPPRRSVGVKLDFRDLG